MLLAAALGAVYVYVLKPENDRIQQTLKSTIERSDRNAQASREADDAKADLQERRDLAFASLGGLKEEFIVKVTNNYKWTKTEAIHNDPIVSGALKVHPELGEPIRRWDTARITDITEKDTDAHFSARDKNYLRTFSNAIGGRKE